MLLTTSRSFVRATACRRLNRSSAWNINYASKPDSEPEAEYEDGHWLFQMRRARMLPPKLAIRRDIRARIESSAVRVPPAFSTLSSMAANIPSTTSQELVFGSPRGSSEIADVPELEVLAKLHPEANEEVVSNNTSEQLERPEAEAPVTSADNGAKPNSNNYSESSIGCPPWYP